jgi:hypothetical protein
MPGWLRALVYLDRRIIFLLMALAITLPMLLKLRVPEYPTPIVKSAFDELEKLPPGSNVLFSFDYEPGSAAELDPMATAMVWHAARKGHKLFFMGLWPLGQPLIQKTIDDVLGKDFPEYRDGEDYVNVGFQINGEGLIRLMCTNIREQIQTDKKGNMLADLPMTRNIRTLRDFKLLVCLSAGTAGTKEWVQYAVTPYGLNLISGVTGVQAPGLYPYYPTQLKGMLGAIKGAAEYEQILGDRYPEFRTRDGKPVRGHGEGLGAMPPQLVAHLLILGLIIAGNVILAIQKRYQRSA